MNEEENVGEMDDVVERLEEAGEAGEAGEASGDGFEVDLSPSLRDVQLRRFEKAGRESFSVIAYACKLNEDASLDTVAELHTQLIRAIMSQTAQRATGILLLQKGAALHLIEAAHEFSSPFMRVLAESNESAALMDACSIVIKLEDEPVRIFQEWSCHSVNAAAEAANISAEDPVDEAEAVLKSLCEIGQQIKQLGKNAGNRLKSLIPSAGRIQAMAQSDDYLDLDDYMDFFESPVTLAFEADKVWPSQELVHVP